MCWNATISMNTFAVSSFAILLAYFNKMYDVPSLLFLFSIAVMQLDEYFLWTFLNKPQENEFFSYCAGAVLLLQPLAAIHLLRDAKMYWNYFVPLYLLTLVFVALNFSSKNMKTVKVNGHLSWKFLNTNTFYENVFIILYLILIFLPLIIEKMYFPILLGFITFLVAYVMYAKEGTFGSMWCWSINIFAVYIIARLLFLEPGKLFCSS
jgi:hypothetical protein